MVEVCRLNVAHPSARHRISEKTEANTIPSIYAARVIYRAAKSTPAVMVTTDMPASILPPSVSTTTTSPLIFGRPVGSSTISVCCRNFPSRPPPVRCFMRIGIVVSSLGLKEPFRVPLSSTKHRLLVVQHDAEMLVNLLQPHCWPEQRLQLYSSRSRFS